MKKLFVVLMTALALSLSAPAMALVPCSEATSYIATLQNSGLLDTVRNGKREWYVTNTWYRLSYSEKRSLVNIFSGLRQSCDNFVSIKVYDPNGNKVASVGSWGIKIGN